MTWFSDLSPCTYFGDNFARHLKAVGWLESGHEYATGRVDPLIYQKLVELRSHPWQPFVVLGCHDCEFCQYEPATGSANVFIPAQGFIYVCPELISHYMNAHGYQPPPEFCEAVMACPEMLSMAYLKAVLANGGKQLTSIVSLPPEC